VRDKVKQSGLKNRSVIFSYMEQVFAKRIQFGLLSSDILRKISVLKVESNDLYEKGLPKPGGLCDLRLGTTDRQFKCQTCNGDILVCPGHFGHIDMVIPVYHIGFMKTVMKVLQTVCFECSRCILNVQCSNAKKKDKRFRYIYEKCKTKHECVHCEAIQPKYSFDAYKIYMEIDGVKKVCTARNALYILKRITDADTKYIGFDPEHGHPRHMILTTVPVSPPQVRPSILMDTSLRSQDDLTHKLSEIIRSNISLEKHIENNASENTILEFTNLLQFHVNTLIDNEIPGQPQATQRTGRPIKALSQRLKAKGGRIRGNLMGKRVNFSARSVITAEPNIDLDELGVPLEIAGNMTIPETVTRYNREVLQKYIDQGPLVTTTDQVGAKYVIRPDGTRCDLRFKGSEFCINIGDVVERTMKHGDLVVFNRQPTLHKMSMMAHKVRVMDHKTFRMNLSATTPYNADFDGDEMNLHLPQSIAAKAELKELMMVTNNIVSAQANKPVIGIVQDSLLASWKMTCRDTFLTWEQVSNIVMNSKDRIHNIRIPEPTIIKPTKLWTGKQVFAMLLPSDFFFNRKSSWNIPEDVHGFSADDSEVIVQDGIIISGQLCKKSLGATEGGVIHRLWLEYSPEMAKNFISSLQYMVNYFIQNHGFSIGGGDAFIDKDTKKKVNESIDQSITNVKQLLHVSKNAENEELFEKKINHILNNAMAQSGRFVHDKITTKNNIHAAVTAGSKGSVLNLSQIMACVGQQNVNGKRITEGYTDRPLPHFKKHDQSPEARGFVKHSYLDGLEAHEFFYHAMGGREGVIDTAVKTSDTGYIQRRLVKSMEDLMVHNDCSMRNSSSDIVQFVYGDDGYDGSLLITQNVYLISNISFYASDKEKECLHAIQKSTKMSSVKTPLLIDIMCEKYKSRTKSSLTHDYVFKAVQEMVNTMHLMSKVIMYQIVTAMSSKRIIDLFQIQPLDFKFMIDTVVYQHNRALVSKGDMTGIIAAQSMGEVVTQLCLNTFHSAGISAKNVTLGVPRFKELINVAKNIKSPTMTLPLKQEYNTYENIDFVAQTLEYVNINSLITRKYMSNTRLSMTNTYIDLGEIPATHDTSIVFHFDINALKRSGKTLFDVYMSLFKTYEDSIIPVYNHENDDPIMEILIVNEEGIDDRYIFILMNKIIARLTIDGTEDIKRTFVRKENDKWIIETDGLNLDFVFGSDYFDHANCTTNHVTYVYEHFGVEAARNTLMKEIKNVIEFDGSYVNRRHFHILVDTMTHKGDIMPITRHGINKANTGPLMKCSFEETMDILTDAGIFSEKDDLNGVTENIIMGRLAPIGTGSMDVMYKDNDEDDEDDEDDDTNICPGSPESSTCQYTDTYFNGSECDDSDCTSTYFPI
jgi:DNA-directed RNA polymerase II subunit RPB1